MQERGFDGPGFSGGGSDSGDFDGRGFKQGSLVLVTLHSPRQKCVGILLRLAPAGVGLRCVDLESLEDLARQLRAGEPAGAATVFFPMHRVERMELDEASGGLPSLAQGFAVKAGCTLEEVLRGRRSREQGPGAEPES